MVNNVTVPIHADVAVTQSGLGAGLGPHLPVGTWSGTRYRSAVRFLAPAGFATWTKITKATLTFWISDHQHVGPAASDIYVRRQAMASPIWSAGEGSQNCNSGFSGSNTTQWDDILPTSADQASFNSGSTANAKKTVTVTAAVEYYRGQGSARIVFVFDQFTGSDYTELWSRDKGSYDPSLYIEYETVTVPDAPGLVSPAAGALVTNPPTLSWTPDLTDGPQTGADIHMIETSGPTVLADQHVTGAATSLVWPYPLDPAIGTQYSWQVRTSNAQGTGAWSGSRAFSIPNPPVIVVSATRYMEFDPVTHLPKLRVKWAPVTGQTHYKVECPVGTVVQDWVLSTNSEHLLSTVPLVSGTAITARVSVRNTYALEAYDDQAFTPRWGLTTHRRDVGLPVPKAWSVDIGSTVPPGAALVFEYGSSTTASAAPEATGGVTWYSDLSSVPKKQFLFYRTWFLPSSTAGPTLDRVTVLVDRTVALVDKWGNVKDVEGLVDPWQIDPTQSVYGRRSIYVESAGTATQVYSFKIAVKQGRAYILTGLMRSEGNSGAHFRLEDKDGVVKGGGVTPDIPVGTDMKSEVLSDPAGRDWTNLVTHDVYRYKTPVWRADGDKDVWVVLAVQGVAGSKAWFDAIKLEESTVATPWSPAAVGAVVVDAGGVQVDGERGGVFRYKGTDGGGRSFVEGSPKGLYIGIDTELSSPATGILSANGIQLSLQTHVHPVTIQPAIQRVFVGVSGTWTKPALLSHIVVECQGGGGAGGGCAATAAGESASSGGGGGGGYARRVYTAAELTAASYAYAAGQGGNPVAGAAGGAGGASSFTGPVTITGNGGGGGPLCNSTSTNVIATGGLGGASTGDASTVLAGGSSAGGAGVVSSIRLPSAGGGSSALGGGGRWGNAAQGTGGFGYGGGGGGSSSTASTAARAGGAGTDGAVIITEYYLPG